MIHCAWEYKREFYPGSVGGKCKELIMMQKAIEYEIKFGKDGKPVTRKWSVGPILIWGIVALVLGLAGKAVISPAMLQSLLSR